MGHAPHVGIHLGCVGTNRFGMCAHSQPLLVLDVCGVKVSEGWRRKEGQEVSTCSCCMQGVPEDAVLYFPVTCGHPERAESVCSGTPAAGRSSSAGMHRLHESVSLS